MSEAKHTPGPWHTGGTSYLRRDDPRMNVWSRTKAGKQSGEILASEVKPANARLMAAAPDLYAALKEARVYVERAYECAFPDSELNHALLQDIDAALAKVEGR